MKTVLLILIGMMCTLFSVVNAQDVVKQPIFSKKNSGQSKKSCEKKITNLSKRAEYYQNKAAVETNKDLAAIYSKCAKAKNKMAAGFTKLQEGTLKSERITSKNSELKIGAPNEKGKNCISGRKKGMRMSTCIKNNQKVVDLYLEKAKQAEQNGKKGLVEQYKEVAAAMQTKNDGLKLISEGKKEFKTARKELKGLKTKTTVKEVAPK